MGAFTQGRSGNDHSAHARRFPFPFRFLPVLLQTGPKEVTHTSIEYLPANTSWCRGVILYTPSSRIVEEDLPPGRTRVRVGSAPAYAKRCLSAGNPGSADNCQWLQRGVNTRQAEASLCLSPDARLSRVVPVRFPNPY